MKTLFALALLLLSIQLFAQQATTYPVIAMELVNTPLNVIDSIGITDSTRFSANMLISLYDTVDIIKLYVKVGKSMGSGDLVTHTFDYDSTPGGALTYSRSGYDLELGLGEFPDIMENFYSEVIIERADHTYSNAITFSRF